MNMQADGTATADANDGAGAGDGQSSNAEVTELTAKLAASVALVAERDASLETAEKAVTDLQGANKKFADDAVGLASAGQQLKEAQLALEESRKTSVDLTTKLEEANTTHSTLQGQVLTSRRKDLVTKFGLPEESVANLDDAGLTVLESTLPHATLAKPNGATTNGVVSGTGFGLDSGPGTVDVSKMTDSERAGKLIERLKPSK